MNHGRGGIIMKRLNKIIAVSCLFVLLSVVSVYASMKQYENFQYDIEEYDTEDGSKKLGAHIYKYTATDSNAILMFPDEIEGFPVLEIGPSSGISFFSDTAVRRNTEEITIPESVEVIGHAFHDCQGLKTVRFDGNNLKKIGDRAFCGCMDLQFIDLPEGITEIGDHAFAGCHSLEEFIIPESVWKLGLQKNGDVETVIYGDSLKQIINMSPNDFPLDIVPSETIDQRAIWYYDEAGTQRATYFPAGKTVYQIKTPARVVEYLNEIEPKILELVESGISMSVANDADSFREYVKNLVGEYNGTGFKVELSSTPYDPGKPLSFVPAIAGTQSNPAGRAGHGNIWIRIRDYDDSRITFYQNRYNVVIIPLPYMPDYDNDSSDDNDNNSYVDDTDIPYWEKEGERWKYKLPDGTYANSQWVIIDRTWYWIGPDGYMTSGWQMVNGKWYLLAQDGAMLTGWQFVSNKWYYMTLNGDMLVNATTPDGYQVGENGEWIQ